MFETTAQRHAMAAQIARVMLDSLTGATQDDFSRAAYIGLDAANEWDGDVYPGSRDDDWISVMAILTK